MSTCNQLDLETLEQRPIMPKNLQGSIRSFERIDHKDMQKRQEELISSFFYTIQASIMMVSHFSKPVGWYGYLCFQCHSDPSTMQEPSYVIKTTQVSIWFRMGIDWNNHSGIQRFTHLDIPTAKYQYLDGKYNFYTTSRFFGTININVNINQPFVPYIKILEFRPKKIDVNPWFKIIIII